MGGAGRAGGCDLGVLALAEPFPLWLAQRQGAGPLLAVTQAARVIHASPAARRAGVKPGMSKEQACLRAKGLAVVAREALAEESGWAELLAELAELTPRLEAVGKGRFWLDLPVAEAGWLAQAYGFRTGVSPWLEVALLAALATWPGNFREIAAGQEGEFLARLPLRFLAAVGLDSVSQTRLAWLGVKTAGELASWQRSQLEAYLGAAGAALWPYLHGPWRRRVGLYRRPLQLRMSLNFPASLEPAEYLPALAELAQKGEGLLAGRAASGLSLLVRAGGLTFKGWRQPKLPLRDSGQILRAAQAAFWACGAAGLEVTRLEIGLEGIFRPNEATGLWQGPRRTVPGLVRVRWLDPQALSADQAFVFEEVGDADRELAGAGGNLGWATLGGLVGLPAQGGGGAGLLELERPLVAR